jgi:hypothetical protein
MSFSLITILIDHTERSPYYYREVSTIRYRNSYRQVRYHIRDRLPSSDDLKYYILYSEPNRSRSTDFNKNKKHSNAFNPKAKVRFDNIIKVYN